MMGNIPLSVQQAPVGAPSRPTVWVYKWVDYSNKYGLGYLLSNGVYGAYFNDSSKAMTGNYRICEYISQSRGPEERHTFNVNPTPPHPHEINKKITLLKYFKQLLTQECKPDDAIVNSAPTSNFVYVKRWTHTKRAIVFRLSNKIVQVNFLEDHTKLILSPGAQEVSYIDKNQNFTTHFLANILHPSISGEHEELVDRLKYTRDILYHMLNHKKLNKK